MFSYSTECLLKVEIENYLLDLFEEEKTFILCFFFKDKQLNQFYGGTRLQVGRGFIFQEGEGRGAY